MDTKKQHLVKVELIALRPTQMTVGFTEVQAKKATWEHLKHQEKKDFLDDHWFPGVLGPKEHYYIIDHHHLGMALLEEGVEHTHLILLKDFSQLDSDEFWTVMEHHQWLHLYDAQGKRCDISALPKKIDQLSNDPYRSLASTVRHGGGFVKDTTPFAEFLWADFFRRRIKLAMLAKQPEVALQTALTLAHSPSAAHLPGWSEQSHNGF
ncbi:MAG: chromosome partitioning protein ParB [Methylococcaceae bacterium]|nr:chromosome partitioning protein ParB [Methylococcaceae bacterium]